MFEDAENLPNEPAALKGLVTTLASELKSRDILIEKLKHQLAGMRQHRFGSRSEALDQLALTLENEEIAASAQEAAPVDADTDQPATPPKGKPKHKPLLGHLPRHETTLSPGDSCTECDGDLKIFGDDVTEELEYVPGRFVVNQIVRPCMAHIRRKFVDIHKSQGSAIAEGAIKCIAKLCGVEKEVRGQPPDQRVNARQCKSKPIFDDLEAWLHTQLTRVSGKSSLAGAIRYALTRMKKLRPWLRSRLSRTR